ncbi:MAG: exodeoxyribonuclease V subunit alpha [Deltaproteobacteria bacterium RIFOXYD12_FULL_57_12]|nr:MAG: exodeoxyribonuclease V subunit alpha [Deltaproteobacteria bacterium RIFOXYD12_FULL_57_12]
MALGPTAGLDHHFARFVNRLANKPNPELLLAAALVSRRTSDGHVCLDLRRLAGRGLTALFPDNAGLLPADCCCPDLSIWTVRLLESGVVGRPGEDAPLVLDQDARLYLHRYWQYEKNVTDFIRDRAGQTTAIPDPALLARGLARLFPPLAPPETDWQKVAALAAFVKPFCVISGGPGTGKTSTVAKILTLFVEQTATARILLAAPTGKAAARLQDAINQAKQGLPISPAAAAALPDNACTLHRLLGIGSHTVLPRFHAANPLPADLVVVDEASMVDLPLMAKLMQALPPTGRLILLGDRNQLASVEPGAVLGDICHPGAMQRFSPVFRALAAELAVDLAGSPVENAAASESEENTLLDDCLVELQKNYRFDPASGIHAVSRMIRAGAPETVIETISSNTLPDINWTEIPEPGQLAARLAQRLQHLTTLLETAEPVAAFAALDRFRILCGLRHGPYGANRVNELLKKLLAKQGQLVFSKNGDAARHYPGQPVMITRNDYTLGLYNGDTGVLLPDPEASGQLRAFFRETAGGFRRLLPLRLPAHETVFAMTVHKSQGSEFDHILLLLPATPSPVLTRELIYTAVTRARRSVEIWGTAEVLRAAINLPARRDSGLISALWGKN